MCYVGDACDVWQETTVRARKRYVCDECFAPIPPGARYVRIGSLSEGSWSTLRVHWECRVLWGAVHGDLCGGEGLMVIGGLDEELREYDHEHVIPGEQSQAAPYRARFDAIKAKYQEGDR